MRLEDAGARTWLLGGAAAWALLTWVLALVGMGAHVDRLPEDAALLRALPPVRPPAPERLAQLGQYDQIAQRPLFAPDRRPHPFSLQPEGAGESAAASFDYVLTSVLITPQVQLAILQSPDGSESARVRVGEAPERTPGWRLVTLQPRSAVFEGPEGQRTLDLRVFDGKGGPPSTPSTAGTPGAMAPGSAPMPTSGSSMSSTPQSSMPTISRPPEMPVPQSPSAPAAASSTPPNPASDPSAAANEQAQMEAIRQRIQARREQQRLQQQSQNK